MARNYITFRLPDRKLLEAFASIAGTIKARNITLAVSLDDPHVRAINCPFENYEGNSEIQEILQYNASLIKDASITFKDAPYDGCSVKVARNGVTDTVSFNFRNPLPLAKACKLLGCTQESLKPFERDESFDKLLGDELAEFYRKREEGLVRLESLSQRIMEQNEEYRRKLDEDAQEVQTQLKNLFQKRSDELESIYKKKDQELSEREESLDKRLKEIDDRSSRHARRQIRKDLKDAIAQRNEVFTLTPKTTRKRYVVHVLFLGLIGMIGVMLFFCLTHPTNKQGVEAWFNLVRIPLLVAGTAASLIYYIRWNDIWFRKHADEEFRTKQFELDVDRASWIVEMALEWKDQKGTELPRELLDRLSGNLFEKGLEPTDATHPSEDLLSALLSASSELKLNLPGFGTVCLDRKGTKQFKRAVEKTENQG